MNDQSGQNSGGNNGPQIGRESESGVPCDTEADTLTVKRANLLPTKKQEIFNRRRILKFAGVSSWVALFDELFFLQLTRRHGRRLALLVLRRASGRN
jgi:hypothetical protein